MSKWCPVCSTALTDGECSICHWPHSLPRTTDALYAEQTIADLRRQLATEKAHACGCAFCQGKRAEEREKRLRERCIELSHAIDQIDCLLLPPEIVKKHTQDVGGPVSNYCMDYDEKAVVERVRKALAVKKIPDGETKGEFAANMHDCHGRWGTRREGLIAWLLRELDYRRR